MHNCIWLVNSCINFHLCLLNRFLNLHVTKLNSHNLWFSDKKTEVLPNNKCLIFIKIGYAQQHMMFNNCVNYHWCWLNSFWNLLLTRLNFQNLWFSHTKKRDLPKNNCSIFIKIDRCLPLSTCELGMKYVLNMWSRNEVIAIQIIFKICEFRTKNRDFIQN